MPIEELENLDGDFAAIVETIPECGGGELPIRPLGGQINGNFRHLGDSAAKKEVVLGHFINFTEAAKQLAELAYLGLTPTDRAANITHPRRAKALLAGKQWSYTHHSASSSGVRRTS